MAPMIILLLVVSQNLIDKEKATRIISGLFLTGYLVLNSFYVANSSSIFFRGTQDYAVKVLATLGDAWRESNRTNNVIALIAKNDPKGLAENIEKVMLANTPIESEIVGFTTLGEAQNSPRTSQQFTFEYNSSNGELVPVNDPSDLKN